MRVREQVVVIAVFVQDHAYTTGHGYGQTLICPGVSPAAAKDDIAGYDTGVQRTGNTQITTGELGINQWG